MNKLFFITRIITFFGSALRCFWEFVVCRMFKLPIEDIRCFKKGELCGHIEHELIGKKAPAFMMAFLPFFLNFMLGLLLIMYASYIIFYMGVYTQIAAYLSFVLGTSLWCNMFPSYEDLLSLKSTVYGGKNVFLKIILAPFTAVVFVGTQLERLSLTLITTAAAAFVLPFATESLIPALMEIKKLFF